MKNELLLEMENITKIYPGVVALDKVGFSVRKGEVHAVVGENGAGKSTLIKILAGSVKKNDGTIIFDGKQYEDYNSYEAINMGISVIYQEFNLVPNMTVEQNIFFGREIKKRFFLDKKKMLERTKEVFDKLDVEMKPNTLVSKLSIAYQQLTEIAKAILNNSKLIIMDEPSATLTNKELEIVFSLIKKLRDEGTSVIYISHRLEEIFEIADRVTVLRDGTYIDTKNVADTTKEELIGMMVGRSLTSEYPKNNNIKDEIVLEVKGLTNEKVRDVSFKLKKGEILGITGLVGAGRTELVRIIFGADQYVGEILVNGEKADIKSPQDAIKYGISLLPEDRKLQGLILKMSVQFNISIASIKQFTNRSFINKKKELAIVEKYISATRIKTPSVNQKVKNLSGGNQQKVILAKWLASNSGIIIFDEPTRGIDVGAKVEIYKLMSALLDAGKSIIMVTSELPELIGISDRALVMNNGRIVGELGKNELTQEKILTLAFERKGSKG